MTLDQTFDSRLDARLDGGDPPVIKDSLWTTFVNVANENADKVAVISHTQSSDLLAPIVGASPKTSTAGLEWTYSQLLQGALGIGAEIRSHGVKPGSVLLAFLPPVCAEWSLIWWTANYLGLTLVTIDKRALEPARVDELSFYIRSLHPEVVIVHEAQCTAAVDGVCVATQHSLKCKMTLDSGEVAANWTVLATLDPSSIRHDDAIDVRSTDFDRTAVVLYTSGTSTGQPKGCPLTERNLATGWSVINPNIHSSRMIMMFANSRAINLHLSSQCWRVGATIVYHCTGAMPEAVLQTIEQEKITDIVFIPPQLKSLVADPMFSKERVKTLKKIFLGGDVASEDLKNIAFEHFPSVTDGAISAYGMTEGLWTIGWPDFTPPADTPVSKGLISSGSILPGSVLKVVDDSGAVAKRGETGEFHIRSLAMIKAYRDNMASDTFYEDDEGRWYKTGDVGFLDEGGHLYVVGRKKDIMKRIGIPVPPILLETVLANFGGVVASVFGLLDEKLGEEPVAVVSSMQNSSVKALQDLVVEHLGPDYALGKVFTLQELGMQEFPINVTGKVMKIELRKAVEKLLSKVSV